MILNMFGHTLKKIKPVESMELCMHRIPPGANRFVHFFFPSLLRYPQTRRFQDMIMVFNHKMSSKN